MAMESIKAWAEQCGTKELFEGEMIADALKNGNPFLRAELFLWLSENLPDGESLSNGYDVHKLTSVSFSQGHLKRGAGGMPAVPAGERGGSQCGSEKELSGRHLALHDPRRLRGHEQTDEQVAGESPHWCLAQTDFPIIIFYAHTKYNWNSKVTSSPL